MTVPGASVPNGLSAITADVLVLLTIESSKGPLPVLLRERGIDDGATGSRLVPEIVI
jgi:hypothetical protein